MKLAIAETDVAKASVQEIKVGEIKVGPVAIDKLVLSNVHLQTSTGTAQMRNVRLAIRLKFSLDWEIGIDISMPDGIPDVHFSRSGTIDLGSLNLGVGFGNLNLPGLANLSFDIPSLPVTNLQAVVGPIKNLNLGATIAQQIQARNLVAPTQGFQISGLSLTKVRAEGLALPEAVIDATTIGQLQGGSLPLTNLTIPNIGLPQALSDDGSLTGRGTPWIRGLITGAMTALGGIGHTLPYLIHNFKVATTVAVVVVLVELSIITWVRHRFMDTPPLSAAMQVA